MKYCLHCKTLNENTQTHCTHCGKRLSNTKRMTPIYCDPIVIAICFALWMFVIPLAAGIFFLMKQKSSYEENMNEYENALLFYGVKKSTTQILKQTKLSAEPTRKHKQSNRNQKKHRKKQSRHCKS